MLVFFALGNAKVVYFALGDAKVPDARYFAFWWNIGFIVFLENGAIILYDDREFINFILLYLRMSEKKVLRSPEWTVASFCTDLASGVTFFRKKNYPKLRKL